jgi:GMP synthase-like glutamine amidotransferase
MSILILQHAANCGAGRLGLCLRDHGFRIDLRQLDLPPNHATQRGKRYGIPSDLDDIHGVIVLGGAQNVGDPGSVAPWMPAEIEFIKKVHAAELPLFGICLGHQLIAHALGGTVAPMDKPEVGFHTVSFNPLGQTDIMFGSGGIAWDFPALQSHGQEVTKLPPGATLLASSKLCKVQAFKAGVRTYAVQFHPECDRASVDSFTTGDDSLVRWCRTVGGDLGAPADGAYPTFARMADRLCVNIATFLLPSPARLSA